MAALAALIGFGILLIYSTTLTGDDQFYYPTSNTPGEFAKAIEALIAQPAFRQFMYAVIGLVLLFSITAFDYRVLGRIAPFLYIFMLVSLTAVIVLGSSAYGAKRWIQLPFFQFQPSEAAKLLIIVVLAKYFSDREEKVNSFQTFALSLLLIAPPVVLVFLQPDVGTMLVIGVIWIGMSIMAGVAWRYLLTLGAIGLAALPIAYDILLHSYMRDRIVTFLDPYADPTGAGYNIIQAAIAIGSGGMAGKGFGQGTQVQGNFLRVQSTDFIFSVLGEEFGFLGAMFLFSLFTVLLFRSLSMAGASRDNFGRLIITGVVVTILFQTFVNIGVNIQLLPVTGIPLPFVSQGGTALMTFMVAFGLVQSIAARRNRQG